MHGPIGDSWPMALFDCPRGHRVDSETHVPKDTGLTSTVATSSRNRASQEPDGHRQEMVPRENGPSVRGAQAACGFK
jgi:hypothetical protein